MVVRTAIEQRYRIVSFTGLSKNSLETIRPQTTPLITSHFYISTSPHFPYLNPEGKRKRKRRKEKEEEQREKKQEKKTKKAIIAPSRGIFAYLPKNVYIMCIIKKKIQIINSHDNQDVVQLKPLMALRKSLAHRHQFPPKHFLPHLLSKET